MSLPLVPDDTDPATVLSSIVGKYNSAWAYKPGETNPWQSYDPNVPPFLNTLTAIDVKMGLWLNMKEPASLTLSGTEPGSTDIAISPGWNFIGYPSNQAKSVPDVLTGVSYNSVWAYDPTLSPSPWQSYDPNVPSFLNTLQQFTPKRGYALNASAPGVVTVNEGTPTPTPPAAALQIHHIDVEQGDAALIISPGGQVATVDDGDSGHCSNTISYLQALGISSIDYHFASHYHDDHIGCLDDLASNGITVKTACYDRGGSYSSATFASYVGTCGSKRQTVSAGQVITLDASSPFPATIKVVALNGAGISTTDENAKSLVLLVSYGAFQEVFAGDLTGESPDVESLVGPQVGDVEVYKVNHHGSKYSSNDNWLDATTPAVGVISVGNNSYGHPTVEALTRLHSHGVKTYWTNIGSGVTPDPLWDKVGGSILIQAGPLQGATYTVSGAGFVETYISQ